MSSHLKDIIENHNRITNMQVVFLDIESYSKRRTAAQVQVIDSFTNCLKSSLKEISRAYVEYTEKNNVNMSDDIIRIPTGDGAAIVFSFDGLHDIHFEFAKLFLKNAYESNHKSDCDQFMEYGWCNCHPYFNVRIGISEGKGVIYKDLNGNYNIAGNVINMASRVMGVADRNQILFTEDAYRQLIDMVESPLLHQKFRLFKNVEIKHGSILGKNSISTLQSLKN